MSEYKCPHCGNPIYDDDALLCLYCGKSLRRKVGFMGRLKHTTPKAISVIIIMIILIAFLLLIIT